MNAVRRALARIVRAAIRRIRVDDQWERFEHRFVKSREFGRHAPDDFSVFLRGDLNRQVRSLDDICEFLLSCRSVAAGSEGASGPWPHPSDFEATQAGDCTAHAVWTWRRVLELGLYAELVAGWQTWKAIPDVRHAWVVFRRDGDSFLIDTVLKDRDALIRRLDDVRQLYRPEYGVSPNGERFAFAGALVSVGEGVGTGFGY